MSVSRGILSIACGAVAALIGTGPRVATAQAPARPSLTGAWTLNRDLSDAPERSDRGDDGRDRARRGGSGGGYGRRGGGGYGRGGSGGGMGRGGGRAEVDPQEMARLRDAMRDLTEASDHLTIVETESMIVITGADGRTTRLSPDGKKVKDENTKIERRTKWDAGRLVSEISGLGPGKATQTFAVDPDSRQLRITVQMEGGRGGQSRTITHVYDADAR